MNDSLRQARTGTLGRADVGVDVGLRGFMLGVYNKMALGLVWSAVLAYLVGSVPAVTQTVLGTPLVYLVQFGPLVLLLGSNFLMRNPSPTGSAALYWSIVTLMGSGLGVWVYLALNNVSAQSFSGSFNVTFTGIAKAFVVTAGAFGALSLWGYTTKKNLSAIGSFLIMASWGLAAIALLNLFVLKSGPLEIGMQIASLGIFGLLVAFQTQNLKDSYFAMQGDQRSLAVMTNLGALNLYIAFIAIFQTLLRLFSSRN